MDGAYPILKDSVRIKKLRSFCWLTELFTNFNQPVTPQEALILSLCTGEFDLDSISYIFAETYRIGCDFAGAFVKEKLEKYSNCITQSECPSPRLLRYRAKEYLYDPLPTDEIRPRCEMPTEMLLSLTHRCNFHCIYCFNAAGSGLQNELDTMEWLDVIRQAKDLGVIHCTLTGGEPMLHPGFFEILESALASDMLTLVCTNGAMLNEETVGRLKELKVPLIQISLDTSDSAICDRLTACPGSFSQITGAIERLAAAGIAVYVKAVLTPLNAAQAGGLVDLCAELGVRNLVLDRYDVSYSGRGNTELMIGTDHERLVKRLVSEKKAAHSGKLGVKIVSYPRKWKDENDIIPCGAFRRSFIVLPDGEVSVCEKLVGVREMSAGNVKESSLGGIWNSPRLAGILHPPPDVTDKKCLGCPSLKMCGTGCFAIKYFLKIKPFDVDPRCFCAEYENNPYAEL
jgi:pyrroloquinoline quinone biosynthesis protein E